MQIQIPPGAPPGSTLQIQLSDGRTVGIQVPPGVPPGSVIQFAVPAANHSQPPAPMAPRPQSMEMRGGPPMPQQPKQPSRHAPAPMLGLQSRSAAVHPQSKPPRQTEFHKAVSTRERATDKFSSGQIRMCFWLTTEELQAMNSRDLATTMCACRSGPRRLPSPLLRRSPHCHPPPITC